MIKVDPAKFEHIDAMRAEARRLWDVEAEATKAASAQDDLVRQAMLDASGLDGHVVQFEKATGYIKDQVQTRRIVVNRVSLGNGTLLLHGRSVSSHGEVGTARLSCDIAKATDLGPLEQFKAK